MNLSLVVPIVSESGPKKLQLIFLKTVLVTQSSGLVRQGSDLHACGPQLCHSLWPITPITLTFIIYRFVWYCYSSWTAWTLKMEATNSSKTLIIGTNQNIIISWKTLIFINTGVWTSDLPRKLILSITHMYRETICCHKDWKYWQQFSWLLYSGIWYHVSS